MSKEAIKLALEALEKLVRFESDSWELGSCRIAGQAIKALREALAEQPAQQEPVAWMTQARCFLDVREYTESEAQRYGWSPLFTSPPAQRKPLTDEEKLALLKKHFNAVCVPEWFDALLLDIEAAHQIGVEK